MKCPATGRNYGFLESGTFVASSGGTCKMASWLRKETIGQCTLYLADAYDMATLVACDSVISDPPYGIGWKPRVNHQDQKEHWNDNVQFDPAPFLEVGSHHLFWGGQFYANRLPICEGWLTWVKRPLDGDFSNAKRQTTFSTTELAWRDWGKANFFAQVWDGGMRAGSAENRSFCHPSQKPVELMEWCLMQLPSSVKSVFDPFMGSGTTGVAAVKLGLAFVGSELDETYFEVACERIRKAYLQPDMFVEAAKPAEQVGMEF